MPAPLSPCQTFGNENQKGMSTLQQILLVVYVYTSIHATRANFMAFQLIALGSLSLIKAIFMGKLFPGKSALSPCNQLVKGNIKGDGREQDK